jgi:hypothetical protein
VPSGNFKIQNVPFPSLRSLGKFSGNKRLSASDIPRAKTQRRQARKKKITFLKRIHFRLSDLCALASLREIFRLSVAGLLHGLLRGEHSSTVNLDQKKGQADHNRDRLALVLAT